MIDVEGGVIDLSAAFPGFGCLDIATEPSEEEGLLICFDSGIGLLQLRAGFGLRIHPPGCASMPEHAVFAGPDSCRTGMILVADHHTEVVALSDIFGSVLFEAAVRGAKAAVPSDLDTDGDIDIVLCGCYEGTGWVENDDGSFGSVIRRMDPEETGMKDVQTLDFDLDGDEDVIAVACCEGGVFVFENRLPLPWGRTEVFDGTGCKAAVPWDLDHDGYTDLVISAAGTGEAGLAGLYNPGPGVDEEWETAFRLPGWSTAACLFRSDGREMLLAGMLGEGAETAPYLALYELRELRAAPAGNGASIR